MWKKIRNLIRLITKKLIWLWWKIVKVEFNSDHELPLNQTIEIPTMKVAVRAVFHKNNKYYPQDSLDECSYKLWAI